MASLLRLPASTSHLTDNIPVEANTIIATSSVAAATTTAATLLCSVALPIVLGGVGGCGRVGRSNRGILFRTARTASSP